ncbi:hypothetical protein JYK14_14420 [Siccirubricoccus sp. KC 17139]|uniref:Uncharacterized protein n=1 Tax=Siccirubricoccus soli TaxID=2899147 RepID=A0ABT1D5Z4_9PROT|nr:hypothetical protein [Siccirubricoccus soli]MCP2683485.1 hypothetical protein [Siccirubricoccus soli]
MNALLAEMIAEARLLPGLDILSLPEALQVTGPDVTWDGPYYSRLLAEAYAFGADRLARLRFGPGEEPEAGLRAALRRAEAQLEDRLRQAVLTEERDRLQAEAAALHAALARAEVTLAGTQAALATVRAELATTQAAMVEMAALQAHLAVARGELAEMRRERDSLRAAAARHPLARLRRALGVGTEAADPALPRV